MNRRTFLRNVGAIASGGETVVLAGCVSGTEEEAHTSTPAEILPFHATNAGIFSDIETLERAVHEATNEFRTEQGYDPLGYNDDLAKIARNHSRNMAKEGFFAHEDHKGRHSGERAEYFGYPDTAISENLFRVGIPEQIESPNRIADRAVQGWKNSPSHRAGMLTTAHIVEGIGGYITAERDVFITAMYADFDGEIPS